MIDVLRHSIGWEEEAGAILDVDTLQSIGIVADPKLVEVGKQAIVGTSASAGTVLDDEVRILSSDAL